MKIRPLDDLDKNLLRAVIGRRCREARLRLGFSYRKTAALFGKSGGWVNEIEHGGQFAPWYYVVALSEAIGEPVGWFCGWGLSEGEPWG